MRDTSPSTAASYAETIIFSCIYCKQHFSAEIWLIVDISQRPDLADRIRANDLHSVVCPNCGAPDKVDAPLLLYRPKAEPTILFSPAQQTSADKDQQQVDTLVNHLCQCLGQEWQVAWIVRGIAEVQRNLLPIILSGDPLAIDWPCNENLDVYYQLIDIKYLPVESGDIAKVSLESTDNEDDLPPALASTMTQIINELRSEGIFIYSPQDLAVILGMRPDLLARLVTVETIGEINVPREFVGKVQQAIDAEQRYLYSGDLNELDSAATTRELVLSHPSFYTANEHFQLAFMNDCGVVYLRRYRALGHLTDLNRALELYQQVVASTSANSPNLPDYLNNLGIALSSRFEHSEHVEDLEQAIQMYQQAVAITPPHSPDLASLLNNLGMGLSYRFMRSGLIEDLEQAIQMYQQAVAITPSYSLDLASRINNLGNGLRNRFMRSGLIEDLEQAIWFHQQAVAVTQPNSPDLPGYLNNLGNALLACFTSIGQVEYLEQAIECYQQAVKSTLPGSPNLFKYLNNLGNGLRARFVGSGQIEDLEQAIRVYQQTVVATPPDSPDLPGFLNNLGIGLNDRFERSGQTEDLALAIDAYQRAVAVTPPNSPDLPGYLSNLGSGLRSCFMYNQQEKDLEQAIDAYQQAVNLTPSNSPDLPSRLNNLGTGLHSRFRHRGQIEDLEQAIGAYQQAVNLTPSNSPDLPRNLNSLGNALRDRLSTSKYHPDDLAQAFNYWQRASQLGLALSAEESLRAARNWLNAAFAERAWPEATTAYGYVRQSIDLLIQIQWNRAAKESWLREARRLPVLAAYALAQQDQHHVAVETLEAGRTRLLAEALEQNRRDLERLANGGYRDLLERYRHSAAQIQFLQQPIEQTLSGQATGQTVQDFAARRLTIEAAHTELNTIIASIRQVTIAGQQPYADFLQPPTFAKLQVAIQLDFPLVYLLATPAGGLALVASQVTSKPGFSEKPGLSEVTAIWLEDLTEDKLREVLTGTEPQGRGGYLGAYDRWRRDSRNNDARTAWHATLDATMAWLWDTVMASVVDHLTAQGFNQAVLIPTGLLGLLPLHAAWTPDATKPTGRRYALDSVTCRYAPSAMALAASQTQAQQTPAGAILAVDNPDGSLHFSGQEVAAILSYFPNEKQKALRGQSATRQATLDALPTYPVLHFATHGWAGWNEPLASGLLMAGTPHLTLRDLLELRLQGARLAVLSACETGLPGTQLPDEVVSMPSGLVQAGVAGVVASLWAVNDLSTAMLMERFYRLWQQDGLSPAAALRQAQCWLRDTTNREKADYFRRDVPALAGTRMPAVVAADLYVDRMLRQPDARDYADPVYWAAFYLTGV